VFDAARVWTGSTNVSDTELGGEYNSDVAVLINAPALAEVYTKELDEMFTAQHFHRHKLDDTPHQLSLPDGTQVSSYFSPSDHARDKAVLPLIQAAQASLDIAMFFFTDADVANALLSAKARGVKIRMVLDAGGAAITASKHSQLCAAGIPVKVENWGGKSHSKWAVADSASVLFGSMNWTGAGDQQNDENTLVVRNAGLARAFSAEFARQWADLPDALVCVRVAAEGPGSSDCGPDHDCVHSCKSGACCDHVDNDFDGHADGADEACACHDGLDNDADGHIDADDFECRDLPDDE
jgi:phosphatidylserine/phosphatidylglycerophosphate/cardiolipin synthase-like enzyme